ncbi:MAG: CBS domain-containing protein [Chloroflexota bacterium]
MSIGRKPRRDVPSRSWQQMLSHVELGTSFQARHLQVELERASTIEVTSTAGDAVKVLSRSNYDFAPATDDGRVVGYVELRQLSSASAGKPVRDLTYPLNSGVIVSADTPISELIEWLPEQRILFVLEGRETTGFITIWDLNKQPARAYLYLVLAGLEIALADLVRWRYGADQSPVLATLGKRDQDSVRGRVGADRDANADSDLVSYLGFKHLLRVFEGDRALREAMGGFSKTRWRSYTWPLSDLRNDVMHPISSFVSSPDDVVALGEDLRRAIKLVDQAVAALRQRYGYPDPEG